MNIGYCVSCKKRIVKPDGVCTTVRCQSCHEHELVMVERLADRLGYSPERVSIRDRDVIQIRDEIHLHDIEDLDFYGRELRNAEAA